MTTSLEPIGGIVADDGGAFWPGWVEENSWYELWTAPSGLGWGFTTGTRAIFGSALAVQPAAVFVGNPVGRFDRATGRGTAAFSDTPMAVGIAADATSVYWLAVGGGIYRASTEDPQHGEILTRTSPGAGLALRGGFLYWFTNVDDRTEIVRVSTRGGTPEALLQWDGDARIVNLVATEHWIIFSRKFPSTDATLVQRIPRNGGELPTTIVAGDLGPGAFAASETCVFYTQRDGSLIRAPIEQMP